MFSVNCLVYLKKRTENSEISTSQYPWTVGDFKPLILSEQQLKIQSYSTYYDLRPRKAAASHIWEPETIKLLEILWGKVTN